jgi:beta-aspartyl-dipeptidase (metallo-type)
VEQDLPKWIHLYLNRGADPTKLTVSSDASISSPRTLFEQIRLCILEFKIPIERMLQFVTSNPAKILKLSRKGKIAPGMDADLLILQKDSLEIRHVIANGKLMIRDGTPNFVERFLEHSNRRINLDGQK